MAFIQLTVVILTATALEAAIAGNAFYDCDFEEGFCNWSQPKDDFDFSSLKWIQTKYNRSLFGTGPGFGSKYVSGHYIYVDSVSPRKDNETARLASPVLLGTSGSCLSFMYHMYGPSVTSLAVYLIVGSERTLVWLKEGSQGFWWNEARIIIESVNNFQLSIEVVRDIQWEGDVAMDSVTYTNKPCQIQHPPKLCEFEDRGYCWFRQYSRRYSRDTHDTFDWSWGNVNSSDSLNHYMYVKSEPWLKEGDNAMMKTSSRSDGHLCIRYEYLLQGSENNILKVYTMFYGGTKMYERRTHRGNESNSWTVTEFTTYQVLSASFYIIFEAVLGSGLSNLIAVDNMVIHSHDCLTTGSCYFSDRWCTWKNLKEDSFDWVFDEERRNRITDQYISFRPSVRRKPGDKAVLRSQVLKPSTDPLCFQFQYRCSGKAGRLKIKILSIRSSDEVWTFNCAYGYRNWQHGKFAMPQYNMDYQLQVEGIVDEHITGNIDMDNFDLIKVSDVRYGCRLTPSTPSPTSTPPEIPTSLTPDMPSSAGSIASCDFESPSCGWYLKYKKDQTSFKWTVVKGSTSKGLIGPFDAVRGSYLYVGTIPDGKDLDTTEFRSPKIDTGHENKQYCLRFLYIFNGARVPTFAIKLVDQWDRPFSRWIRQVSEGPRWRLAEVSLDYFVDSQVNVVAQRRSIVKGDIAIDEISLSSGFCNANVDSVSCDFEAPYICGYKTIKSDRFYWVRARAFDTAFSSSELKVDHTLRTYSGCFVGAMYGNYHEKTWKAGNFTGRNFTGRIISPPVGDSNTTLRCLSFWYFMTGENVGSLRLYTSPGNETMEDLLWEINGEHGYRWQLAMVTVNVTEDYQFIFEVEHHVFEDHRGGASIDDVVLLDGECQPRGSCDFENERCTWANIFESDDIDWLRIQKRSTPFTYGLPYDHTLDTNFGHYMYMDNTGPMEIGEKAALISEAFNPSENDSCVEFWFYKTCSDDVSSLRVKVMTNLLNFTSTSEAVVWEITNSSAVYWTKASASVPAKYTVLSHQIIIEGVVGRCYHGSIGIDDITVSKKTCVTEHKPVQPTSSDADCQFYENTCKWTQFSSHNLTWYRHYSGGPLERKTRFGGYVYVVPDKQHKESHKKGTAVFLSPVLPPTGNNTYCFTFKYLLYGPITGHLSVYVDSGKDHTLVWRCRRSQLIEFIPAQFNVTINATTGYQIWIEAEMKQFWNGYISLSEIKTLTQPCPHVKSECDFDKDLCGYTQDTTDDADWRRKQGYDFWGSVSKDHTYGQYGDDTYRQGYCMNLPKAKHSKGDLARLISEVNPPTTGKCLWFFYVVVVDTETAARVYLRTNGTLGPPLWHREKNQGLEWTLQQVSIVSDSEYQIVFEGQVGNWRDGSQSIDDITIQDGLCDEPGNCEFEKHVCGYINQTGDFDWVLREAGGVLTDRTTNHSWGQFMAANMASPVQAGWSSILRSEMLTATNISCLQFSYMIMGDGDADFMVYHRSAVFSRHDGLPDFGTPKLLYKTNSACHVKRKWIDLEFNITAVYIHMFIFQATKNLLNSNIIIGLDSIIYQNGSCGSPEPVATSTQTCLDCTFEDYCDYRNDGNNLFNWTVTDTLKPFAKLAQGAPRLDTTFAYANVSSKGEGEKARYLSPVQPGTDSKGICLSFKYHVFGFKTNRLIVYKKTGSLFDEVLWKSSTEMDNEWRTGHAHITSQSHYQIVFEAVVETNTEGDIAIDNISGQPGPCPESGLGGLCDFEKSDCGYNRSSTYPIPKYTWIRQKNLTTSLGPAIDHTLRTIDGFYMYLKFRSFGGDSSRAMTSPSYPATNTSKCLTFWYNLYSSLQLTVSIDTDSPAEARSKTFGLVSSEEWLYGTIDVNTTSTWKVKFEGSGSFRSGKGTMGVDDVQLVDGQCPAVNRCTFESDNCGYTNYANYTFMWVRSKGDLIPSLGPGQDHTSKSSSGHYMLIKGKKSDGKARIYSQPMSQSSVCVSFWYQTSGKDTASLMLRSKTPSGLDDLWKMPWGEKGVWRKGQAHIASVTFYMIVFEGQIIAGNEGYLAIDDVFITSGECPQIVTPTPAPSWDVTCSFAIDLCGWREASSGSSKWVRKQSGIHQSVLEPPKDASSPSDGFYVQLNTSGQALTGKIESPKIVLNGKDYCFSFWYYLFGPSAGKLSVNVQQENQATETVWSKSGSQFDRWIQAKRTLTYGGEVTLAIEASASRVFKSIQAVDDVHLTAGACEPSPGCSFEDGFCEWRPNHSDEVHWSRGRGSMYNNTVSMWDHTYGSNTGHFLFIETSSSSLKKTYYTGSLVGPDLPANSKYNLTSLMFWYRVSGNPLSKLHLKNVNRWHPTEWTASDDLEVVWRKGCADIAYPTKPFHWEFQVQFTNSGTGQSYVALDDIKWVDGMCQNPGSCDFETDMCGFVNDPRNEYDWLIGSGASPSRKFLGYGPVTDHTTDTSAGQYAYIDVGSVKTNTSRGAWLVSETLNRIISVNCLSFNYFMNGSGLGNLSVYLSNKHLQQKSQVFSSQGDEGNVWNQVQLSIQPPPSYQVIFEHVFTSESSGIIALDDISITVSKCVNKSEPWPPKPKLNSLFKVKDIACDFEYSLCKWHLDQGNSTKWKRTSGFLLNGKVAGDHTHGDMFGHFLYSGSSSPSKGVLKVESPDSLLPSVSQSYGKHQSVCFRFWYNMQKDAKDLRVYSRKMDNEKLLWTRSGDHGPEWHYAQIFLDWIQNPISLVIEAVGPDTAIDDVSAIYRLCPDPSSCDFEVDLCSYRQSVTDDFNWRHHRGYSASGNYLPRDHTYRTKYGGYMYIDPSSEHRQGSVARLQSSELNPVPAACLQFWFYFEGEYVEELGVYRRQRHDFGEPVLTLNSRNGTGTWMHATVDISSSLSYYLSFEGIIGNKDNGYVAIDDIEVTPLPCKHTGFTTPSSVPGCYFRCYTGSKCVSYGQVCDFHNDCSQGEDELSCGYDCNFDKDTCSWSSYPKAGFTWLVSSTESHPSNTGPMHDHTSGSMSGRYLYVAATAYYTKHTAEYQSPLLAKASASCHFKFWYYMKGTDIGVLSVYKVSKYGKTKLWSLKGDQGADWIEAVVPTGKMTTHFSIILQARRSYRTLGGIAVDDISFVGCDTTVPNDCHPGRNKFFCADAGCIDQDRVCDFHDDCGDASDEIESYCSKHYTRCNFEHNTCFWREGKHTGYFDNDEDFHWTRKSPFDLRSSNGPSFDHTLHNIRGTFLYLNTSLRVQTKQYGRIISGAFAPTLVQGSCKMTFFYQMYDSSVSPLSVYLMSFTDGSKKQIWESKMADRYSWHKALVTLDSEFPFQIMFEATVGKGLISYMAIDDISFTHHCEGYFVPSHNDLQETIEDSKGSPCSGFICQSGQCISKSEVCNFKTNCQDSSDEISCGVCNFESGMCGWSNADNEELNWQRRNSGQELDLTVPINDHTLGTCGFGSYMVSPKSNTSQISGQLVSPVYGQFTMHCSIIFWVYKTTGEGLLTLNLQPKASSKGHILWNSTNVGDNRWLKVAVKIGLREADSRISFEVRNNPVAEYRIDDVSFTDCLYTRSLANIPCQSNSFRCSNSKIISKEKKCDFTQDCLDGSDEAACPKECNFRSDSCGWYNVYDKPEKWIVASGFSTQNIRSRAPATDASGATDGSYVLFFVPILDRQTFRNGVLKGPQFSSSLAQCFISFSYYMSGTVVGTLSLSLRDQGGPHKLWENKVSKSTQWNRVSVTVGRREHPFRLSFIHNSVSFLGTVAIDDIEYTLCGVPNPQSSCNSTEILCSNKVCVDQSLICDFTNDCGDGSDESAARCSSYKTYNFENDFGAFIQVQNKDGVNANWLQGQGLLNLTTGPLVDHTTGLMSGHFLYFDNSKSTAPTTKAQLVSRHPITAGFGCRMRFYYYLYGSSQSSLTVSARGNGTHTSTTLWSATSSDNPTWIRVDVATGSSSSVEILIEGKIRSPGNNVVAIDDVSYTPGCEEDTETHTTSVPKTSPATIQGQSSRTTPGQSLRTTRGQSSRTTQGQGSRATQGHISAVTTQSVFSRSTYSEQSSAVTTSISTKSETVSVPPASPKAPTTGAQQIDFPIYCNLSRQFQCKSNSKCIKKIMVCNGEQDCDDNSDENSCGCSDKQCQNGGTCYMNWITKEKSCLCSVGYEGDTCQSEISQVTSQQVNTPNTAAWAAPVGIIICLAVIGAVVAGVFLWRRRKFGMPGFSHNRLTNPIYDNDLFDRN